MTTPLFISLLLAGPLMSILVSLFVTRKLMSRGLQIWGFIIGLAILVSILGIGQWLIAQEYRAFFSEVGPCPTCCELCGLTFLFWWFAWGTGLVIYLIISAVFAIRFRKTPRQPTPLWVKRLGGGTLIIIFSVVTASALNAYRERLSIRSNIAQAKASIFSGTLSEIGSMMLPQDVTYWLRISIPYVEHIQFSQDGKWFSLQYSDRLEIWQMADLTLQKTFRPDSVFWESIPAFSPDSSRLAVWLRGDIQVYSLDGKAIELLWEIKGQQYNTEDLAFSADSRELIMMNLDSQDNVVTLDAKTGHPLATVNMPSQGGFFLKKLSQDSEYLYTGNEQVFQIYDRHSGQLVHQIDTGGMRASLLPNNDVLLLNCQGPSGKIWDIETGKETSFPLDLRGCQYSLAALVPDSHSFSFAGLYNSHEILVWDVHSQSQIGQVDLSSAVTAIAVTPDQRVLVVATADGRLNFFANNR